jgi:DNA-binding response OmpR family regulator
VQLARELNPDLITLDILMPTGSGWAVLAQLKSDAASAAVPVIIVSIVDRKELGFLLGASEYLVKPVSREQLLESVRRHVVPGMERRSVLVKQVAGD